MNPEPLPNSPEQYDPNLEAQDEDVVSGGNNRLMYILGAVILALVVAYIALPKGKGSALASVAPSFVLDDAAVTATAPTAADSVAAGLKAAAPAKVAADAPEAAKTTAAPLKPATALEEASAVATAAAPVAAPVAAAPVAAAPVAVPVAAPVAAPEPAAPTNVAVSGKIDDENGRPLIGATVMLKGSSKAASTDASGKYSIEVPAGTENTLMYGYGGYEDTEVRTRGGQLQNVTLTPRAKAGRKRR